MPIGSLFIRLASFSLLFTFSFAYPSLLLCISFTFAGQMHYPNYSERRSRASRASRDCLASSDLQIHHWCILAASRERHSQSGSVGSVAPIANPLPSITRANSWRRLVARLPRQTTGPLDGGRSEAPRQQLGCGERGI